MRRASSVGRNGLLERSNSVPPSNASNCCMRRDTADCVRQSLSAARVREGSSNTAIKALRSSIIMPNAHFKNENNALAAQRSSTLTYCLQRPALMPFQRSRKSRNQIMPGVFALTRSGDICVHSYTAPEAGWLVNTHILETGTQLLVVDAQYTLDYAR